MTWLVDRLESRLLLSVTGATTFDLNVGTPANETGTIIGVVAHDLNGNGTLDPGDVGLSGWQVWLDDDRDSQIDPGEAVTVTGRDGLYRFNNAAPGFRVIQVTQQPGWLATSGFFGVEVRASETVSHEPFLAAHGGIITGWVKTDNDGRTGSGVAGWTVYLDLNENELLDPNEPSRVSQPGGWYHFGGIAAGDYLIREVVQPGYRATSPASASFRITVWDGLWSSPGTFHNTSTGEIRGTFFRDLDRDGVRDEGEPGIPNWSAYIDTNSDGRRDFPEPVAFGDDEGNYAFGGLVPGTYTIRPWGETDTLVKTAPEGGAHRVTFTGPKIVTGKDFGYARLFAARVGGRRLFYASSAFDTPAEDGGPGTGLGAVAADKRALLPGQAATFVNLSSYSKGINGLILDVFDMANPTLTADDFEFQAGDEGNPAQWSKAPQPWSVESASPVFIQSPLPEPGRVVIRWAPGAIVNTWLRVTIKANHNTGLRSPDVFYFGSLVGETGDDATPARVGALDLAAVKRAMNTESPLTGRHDFDRNGKVNALDLTIARRNLNESIPVFSPPAPAALALRSVAADVGLLPREES